MDVGSRVVSALSVLPLQRYYGGGLARTRGRQQESRGRLPVMMVADVAALAATGQRYVAGAPQRYDRTRRVVGPRRPVFGVTVVNSAMGEGKKNQKNVNKKKTTIYKSPMGKIEFLTRTHRSLRN